MELCEYLDLRKFLNEKKRKNQLLDQNIILVIIKDICLGLKELYKNNIIHRDLKPENLFISQDYKIKIGDFGESRRITESTKYAHSFKGTFNYMAPEMFKKDRKYDNRVDVWSFGCIIYELCTLSICFDDEDDDILEIKRKIINENHGSIDLNYYNIELQNLIDLLLKKDYKQRPKIDEVYNLINQYNQTLVSIDNISLNLLKRKEEEAMNEITLKIEVKENEKYEIYFLDGSYFEEIKKIEKDFHIYSEKKIKRSFKLKGLNDNNTELYIDDIKRKFSNCYKFSEGIHSIKLKFKILLDDCCGMFYNCSNIFDINLSKFNSKNVANMAEMFYNCHNLKNLNLSNLDTRNVTTMESMFFNCSNLTSIDLSSFNTKNVTDMESMFFNCSNLTSIDLSSFNTKNVTDMGQMFCSCEKLTSIDLSSFNTKNVRNMESIFSNCLKLTSLDFSTFNTDNVENISWIFGNCKNIRKLDLSYFNTKKVKYMNAMFYGCENLEEVILSSFDTENVYEMGGIFWGCKNLTELDLSSFNIKNVNDLKCWPIFVGCKKLNNLITNDSRLKDEFQNEENKNFE